MQTAAINDTLPLSQSRSGPFAGAKANTMECELFMAAMQALLAPDPFVMLQNKNELNCEKNAFSEAAGQNLNIPLLPGGLMVDAVMESPVTNLQELSTPSGVDVDSGKVLAQNQAIIVNGASLPEFTTAAPNNGKMRAVENVTPNVTIASAAGSTESTRSVMLDYLNGRLAQELKNVWKDGAGQGKSNVSGAGDPEVFPARGQAGLERQVLSKESYAGSVLQRTQTDSSGLTGPRLKEALITAEMAQIVEKGARSVMLDYLNERLAQELKYVPDAVNGASLLKSTSAAQGNGQMRTVVDRLNQVWKDVDGQKNGILPGAGDPVFSPSRGQSGLEQQVMSGESHAGSDFKRAQTDSRGLTGPRVREALIAAEMVQIVEEVSEVNAQKDEYSSGKTETLRAGSGAGVDQAANNISQSSATPNVTIASAASSAESTRSVMLDYLNERLAQELKNVLDAGKGETQTKVQLKLEPEHLGQLTIKLFFSRDELIAHFYTGNNQVKEILEGSLQQLRESLSQHDLKLNEALVFTSDDSRGSGMGGSYQERDERTWSPYKEYNSCTYADTQEATVDSLTKTTDSTRINYLI